MKKLNYVQSKLLKKTDFFNFKNESLHRENLIVSRYRLKDQDQYRQYNKLVGRVTELVAELRKLPEDSPVKNTVAKELLNKLYRMGIIKATTSLDLCEKLPVSAVCRRRICEVLKRLKFAQHSEHAETLVLHGHIRIGADVVTDPATLVTRDMEDLITWAEGSKYKRAVKEFRNEADDFELLNC